jgi:hypothetical protein
MNDRSRDAFDLEELLHPAHAFERPHNEDEAPMDECMQPAC